MKTIGFPISHKENEKRRAIVPEDIVNILAPDHIFVESGFGEVLGIPDEEYIHSGVNVCSRDDALGKDIICDPKVGDAEYLSFLHEGQTVFGWIHATQNRDITDKLINGHLTAYAWENMFEKGRHVFWFNNELAGEAAIMHAFQCYGKLPYGLRVAVLGNGNTARGAIRVLNMLGANVVQYNRQQEELFKEEFVHFDVIVNCILWDVLRRDHIIYRRDLSRMKRNSLIIDVSCDRNGGIETSIPTSIENPTYTIDGIIHYAVDHTPSLFYKTFSYNNSRIIVPFINELMTCNESKILQNSLIIRDGVIIDKAIIQFQSR